MKKKSLSTIDSYIHVYERETNDNSAREIGEKISRVGGYM
jgi:hypothetical protein